MNLLRKIANLLSRGTVKRVYPAANMQRLQVGMLSGETREVEHFQPYGFASVPPEGAEVLLVSVGGNRDHVIALVVDDRAARAVHDDLQPGEVALTHPTGARVLITADGAMECTAAPGKNIVMNEGSTPVAKEGSATTGHTHGGGALLAGGFLPVSGTSASATDTIAVGEGSQTVLVP